MADLDRERWNRKYSTLAQGGPPRLAPPDSWLVHAVAHLKPGRALELACGLGHNAIWLARQGWTVDAVDVSSAGLEIAAQLAERCGVDVRWIAADLDFVTLDADAYDLVTVFRFLDRRRFPEWIPTLLRPQGRLVYETFTVAQLARSGNHLKCREFLLEPDELPRLFPELTIEEYVETELAERSVGRLIARRPAL